MKIIFHKKRFYLFIFFPLLFSFLFFIKPAHADFCSCWLRKAVWNNRTQQCELQPIENGVCIDNVTSEYRCTMDSVIIGLAKTYSCVVPLGYNVTPMMGQAGCGFGIRPGDTGTYSKPHSGKASEHRDVCLNIIDFSVIKADTPAVFKEPTYEFITPTLNIPLLSFSTFDQITKECLKCSVNTSPCPKDNCIQWGNFQIPWFSEYLFAIYKWGVVAAAILAVLAIVNAGFSMIQRAASPEELKAKRDDLIQAILGLVFVLLAYQILSFINPKLTIFKPISLSSIKKEAIEASERTGSGYDNTSATQANNNRSTGNTFSGYITVYYVPEWDGTGKTLDLRCQMAIECGCKNGTSSEQCPSKYGNRKACNNILSYEKLKEYCFGGAGGSLTAFSSAAADGNYPVHTKFIVSGASNSRFNGEWEIMDRGSAVKGTHFDLFIGELKDNPDLKNFGGSVNIQIE